MLTSRPRPAGRTGRSGPSGEDGVFAVYFCAHRIGAIDFREAMRKPVDLWTKAAHWPQGPQEEQQQQTASS